jgi:hypothetical protein
MWRACFPGSFNSLLVDSKAVPGRRSEAAGAQTISCTTVDIGAGDTRTVQIFK